MIVDKTMSEDGTEELSSESFGVIIEELLAKNLALKQELLKFTQKFEDLLEESLFNAERHAFYREKYLLSEKKICLYEDKLEKIDKRNQKSFVQKLTICDSCGKKGHNKCCTYCGRIGHAVGTCKIKKKGKIPFREEHKQQNNLLIYNSEETSPMYDLLLSEESVSKAPAKGPVHN